MLQKNGYPLGLGAGARAEALRHTLIRLPAKYLRAGSPTATLYPTRLA